MSAHSDVARMKQIGAGASFIVFPLMLLSGFLLHPNFLSLELVTDAEVWASEFRGNFLFHLGHLIVLLTVPLIIVVGVRCMRFVAGPGGWLVFVGGVLLLLLPLGFALQAAGLARAGVIDRGQAVTIVVGLLLLLAGDIELITSVGALLLCVGYIPMGLRELNGRLKPEHDS